MDELLDTNDAIGIAAAIRSGEVSAREVVERTLARLDERNPALNAVIARCDDAALAAVANGAPTGPLGGVPFVVKDLGMTVAGLPATGGSRLFADVVATSDSELVARYRRAGLVIVGTTNTPELGRNPSTEPLLHGPTRNPHDLGRSPGGSSGGTAAAVAAGIVPLGHGNDGGGSIRIPASACGLVGLKPSRGRVTAAPKRTLLSYPLGINHVLTRTVRDSALLLDLTAGPVTGDPYVIAQPSSPWLDEVGLHPGRCRIAVDLATPAGEPVHPDCAAVVSAVASLLADLGHDVDAARPSFPLDALSTSMTTFMGTSLIVDVDDRLAELGRPLRDDDLEPLTRMIYDQAQRLSGAAVARAHMELERAARTIGAFFVGHDLLLTSTLARPVPPLGLLDTTNLTSIREHAAAYAAMASPYNVTGQPAISLPLGVDAAGLPVGVQLVAAYGREDLLLRVAAQLESARPWSIAPVWPAVDRSRA
jgi:amidase